MCTVNQNGINMLQFNHAELFISCVCFIETCDSRRVWGKTLYFNEV